MALIGLLASQTFAMGPETGWHHGAPFAYDKGLLDSIGFDRSVLADKGVNVHFSQMAVYQNVADGGPDNTDNDEFSNSYDLQLYFDSARMGLWKNGYAIFRAEGKSDDAGVNPKTGAIIPVNFDAVVPEGHGKSFEITEWWYSHEFLDGMIEPVIGMYDIARFFDINPYSAPYHYRFLNAHMFFNSVLLPYAPYNILGGVVLVKPAKWLTVTTGIGDPNSSAADIDWFEEGDINLLHEWRFMAKPFGKMGIYNIGLAYTDVEQSTIAQDSLTPGTDTKDDDWAYYGSFAQALYQDPNNQHKTVGLFGRVGVTNGDINIIERHYSLGVTFDGMISSRPKDVFGIVGWHNKFSDDLSSTLDDSSEGVEAFYRFQVTNWLQVSPDVQYLLDPGIQKGADDTLVLGLRALIHL
jgi:porin